MDDKSKQIEDDEVSRITAEQDIPKKQEVKDLQPVVDSCVTIAPDSYQIKPTFFEKFKPLPVREVIRSVVSSMLSGKIYEADKVKKWTVDIANEINVKVTDLKMNRYKHIVQVILGEQRGAGVRSGVRCLWDAETDGYTSDIFTNDSLFCLTVVYAVYLY